jgi:hypothetical protein
MVIISEHLKQAGWIDESYTDTKTDRMLLLGNPNSNVSKFECVGFIIPFATLLRLF